MPQIIESRYVLQLNRTLSVPIWDISFPASHSEFTIHPLKNAWTGLKSPKTSQGQKKYDELVAECSKCDKNMSFYLSTI